MHRKTKCSAIICKKLSTTGSSIKELNLNYFGDLPWTSYYAQIALYIKQG